MNHNLFAVEVLNAVNDLEGVKLFLQALDQDFAFHFELSAEEPVLEVFDVFDDLVFDRLHVTISRGQSLQLRVVHKLALGLVVVCSGVGSKY